MLASVPKSLTRLSPPKTYPPTDKIIGLGLLFLFIFSWSSILNKGIPGLSISRLPAEPIKNATLGFQEVFALALSGRDDRTRPLLDAAKATNITITVLNAARDADIPKESWPEDWKEEDHSKGEIGCLTSHVRTWNRMITHNISTALIMESDADWDMRIKDLMPQLAYGIRMLVDWPFEKPHHTQDARIEPYGDTWDIVWIGHCGSNHQGNTRIYSWNDTSVPPEDKEYIFDIGLTKEQHVPGTRTVFQFGRTTCSTAYAISLQGAKKLVEYFKQANRNLDLHLSEVCTGGNSDLTCLGVWPQLITASKSESNIDHNAGQSTGTGTGLNPGPAIQYSARMNAKKVLEEGAGRAEWKAEWDTSWAEKNGTWDMVKMKNITADEE